MKKRLYRTTVIVTFEKVYKTFSESAEMADLSVRALIREDETYPSIPLQDDGEPRVHSWDEDVEILKPEATK